MVDRKYSDGSDESIVAWMPTLASCCCSASATLGSLPLLRAAITVVKPFGLPHLVSSSLALARSGCPVLPVYGARFASYPSMFGGSMLVPIAPPASGPPRTVCSETLSVAYCTAIRQWMLSHGGGLVVVADVPLEPV